MRIDPHTHSNHSDGTDTPEELMRAAAAARLDVVGLTDHDTFSGWEEAEKYVDSVSVGLLRGVEMSCSYEGVTVHLLAYLFDPSDGELTGMLSRSLATRQTRGRAIVENLSADYPITWEDVVALAPDGGPVGRPHIADALVNAGFFPNRSAVFEQVLHPRGPYYVHHWAPNPIEAVHAIREAGGVPILAHPRAVKRQKVLAEDVIVAMSEAGLFGIERDHRDHDADGRADVERIARACGLRMSGASDYHGGGKPNQLGENLMENSVLRALEEEGHLPVLFPRKHTGV